MPSQEGSLAAMMSNQSRQCCRGDGGGINRRDCRRATRSRGRPKRGKGLADKRGIGAQAFAALGHAYGAACVEGREFFVSWTSSGRLKIMMRLYLTIFRTGWQFGGADGFQTTLK